MIVALHFCFAKQNYSVHAHDVTIIYYQPAYYVLYSLGPSHGALPLVIKLVLHKPSS